MNPFTIARRLRRFGVLGINERNAEYTLRHNPRRFYPRVDDKMKTKQICRAAGIPTARVLVHAETQAEVRDLVKQLYREESFVLKPARGAMGNGILVVTERDNDRFLRAGDGWVGPEALRFHASSIVSGLYALGGQRDVAFAEERLEVHPGFREISEGGVPDIRIVIYRGVPVMAMTRLPTRASRGRANLHQGAVGAGIDLASGRTTRALWRGRPCSRHPDTGQSVAGRRLPSLSRAIDIAVRSADATELGYVGADVVVDEHRGPVLLELNARPGLAVQLANQAGLGTRLAEVDRSFKAGRSVEQRIALGKTLGEVAGAAQ